MPLGFWYYVAVVVANLVIGELLRPKIKVDNAKPQAFDTPTSSQDRPVGLAFGTVVVKSPNVSWSGDRFNVPIKKKAGKGGFLGTGSTIWQTVGYRYHVGMLLSLCIGPVDLLELRLDDKVAWSGTSSGGEILIDNEGLFGGEESGGGVVARIAFLPGTDSQAVNSYLASQLGSPCPAWRGRAALVWYGPSGAGVTRSGSHPVASGYVGTQPRVPNLSAKVRHLPSSLGLTGAQTNLNGGANAAEVIYYVLTALEDDGGLAVPSAQVNIASFVALGHVLATEGMGLNILWDRSEPAGNLIGQVLAHVDAVLYLDPSTGLWTVKAAREDYDPATLLVLDESNSDLDSLVLSTPDDRTNEVLVSYTDPVSWESLTVRAQDSAGIRYQQQVNTGQISYPYVVDAAVAQRLAWRDLRALALGPAQVELTAQRVAAGLRPGGVFKHSWDGITRIMRVQRVVPGIPGDPVKISAIQDVFSMGSSVMPIGGGSQWTDPLSPPSAPMTLFWEMPYALAESAAPKVWVLAKSPTPACTGFEIWIKDTSASYTYRGSAAGFTPVLTLLQPYARHGAQDSSGDLVVQGPVGFMDPAGADEQRLGRNLGVFETGEIISWGSASWDEPLQAWRLTNVWTGLLDSVPADHAAGERLWMSSWGQATTDETYLAGYTLSTKLLPFGPRGSLPLVSGSAVSLTLTGRAAKPYPPALARVQGVDALTTSVGDLVATWRHRDRLSQVGVIPQDDPAATAPEGTYTIKAYVAGVLKRTIATGSSAATATYTGAMRAADDSDGTKTVEIGIQASTVNGNSAEARTRPLTMTGFGLTFGNFFGGIQA